MFTCSAVTWNTVQLVVELRCSVAVLFSRWLHVDYFLKKNTSNKLEQRFFFILFSKKRQIHYYKTESLQNKRCI